MLNMDMIGRIKDNKVYIGGVGTGSTFKAILEQAQKQEPDFKIEYSAGGYAASDHTSFVAKKIPVLFFFSGLHSDYHKPSDTWDKINAPSAAQLLNLVGDVALQLADAPSPPTFITVVEDKPVRRRWRRLRAVLRLHSRLRRGQGWRALLRRAAGIAGGEGRTEGRRHPGAVRR